MVGYHQRHTPAKLAKPFVGMMERSVRFAAPGIPETRATRLRKGLALGCPASPFFTMFLETVVAPLVRIWQDRSVGVVVGRRHTPMMALADDIYLLGRSKHEVEVMSRTLQALHAHSLALQPAKCAWLATKHEMRS